MRSARSTCRYEKSGTLADRRPTGSATGRREPRNKGESAALNKLLCISTPLTRGARMKISGSRSRVRAMTEILEETSPLGVIFSRTESIAEEIEARIRAASVSIDAALYRFGNPRLSQALCDAQRRGVSIRLIADRGKFEDSEDTRNLLSKSPFPFCLTHGRDGARSKMHHKFVILDGRTVLTGSYNWTLASEEQNYENLLILRDPLLVDLHRQEFDSLWASVTEAQDSESPG